MDQMNYRHGTRDPYPRIVPATHAPSASLAADPVGRGMREKGIARKIVLRAEEIVTIAACISGHCQQEGIQ
jgi:hypothetical protein